MKLAELEIVVNKFAKYVVQQAKSNLSKKGKRASGKLYNSIKPKIDVRPEGFYVYFDMEDYGVFQDKGVRGTEGHYADQNTAGSPFKFGSGSGPKGGLTTGIENWIKLKKFQFRDKKGRFMSYQSMRYIIVNSIWRNGLRATMFFSNPFDKGIQRFGDEFLNAFLLDTEKQVILGIKK